ncbi:hypothetical protein ACPYOC_02525 [Ornithinimicrobium sp. W1665]|uniref:hypothetical protein n=1 Tax=Ornithinimicrobium sp. W1665 TaxID=3416666 RepID=UPI003CEABF48
MSASGGESAVLRFADGETVADLATYAGRALTLDEEGAVRLQARGDVLAAWVCVLPGQGLTRAGTVLGLRTMPLADGHDLDVAVPLRGLTDRFARRSATGDAGTELTVPPTTVSPPWTALTPPRAGWEPVGRIPVADLLVAARAGVAEVARGTPEGAGSAAVAALRARVWSRELTSGVPAGAGLAVLSLGFARDRDDEATVHRSGPWTRVSVPAGHVLCR